MSSVIADILCRGSGFGRCRSPWQVLCLGLIIVSAVASAEPPGGAAGRRQVLSLNGQWLLKFDEMDEGEYGEWERADSAARTWQRVRVPHSWNQMPERQEYQGVVWYRRTFHLPNVFHGKHVLLKFQCAAQRIKIWLNGEPIGEHEGGFIPFSFGVSDVVRTREPNVLVVRCDSTVGEGATEGWPWGGLAGKVTIEAAHRAHVADMQVQVEVAQETAFAGQKTALVDVGVGLRNTGYELVAGELSLYVGSPTPAATDLSWRLVARRGVSMLPDGESTQRLSFALDNPELWHLDRSSAKRASLYELRAVLVDEAGNSLDTVLRRFGIRSIRVSGERLLVNGEWVRLVGVSRFPDHPEAGGTERLDTVEADLAAIQAANGVMCHIRCAAPHPNVVKVCDERGILLSASLPICSPSPETAGDAEFVERHKQLLREMIEAYRHHPSVWSWSLGEGIPDGTPEGGALVSALRDVAKRLDPGRPVTFTRPDGEPDVSQAAGEMDYISVGGFFGTKRRTSVIGETLDKIHAVWPDKMVVISGWGGYNDGGATTETAVARAVDRDLDEIRQRPFVGALLWGSLSHHLSARDRDEGYDKQEKVAWTGLLTRERQPLNMYAHLGEALGPIRIRGLAYMSNSFAAGDPLITMVGLKIASPVAQSLPCYGLTSYVLRWSIESRALEPPLTEKQFLSPFRPDYFAESERTLAWQRLEWTPSREDRATRVLVDVLRPVGRACATRVSQIRFRPQKGSVQFERGMAILDLGAYFNCDGVSSDANRLAGNFDAPHVASGASYPASELPESHSIFVAVKDKAIPLLFPDKGANANNISCAGQSIIVPPDRYRSVNFLGSAENGGFERTVTLVYTSGSDQERQWRMGDWCSETEYDEVTVIKSAFRHGWAGEVEQGTPCYIRWQSISADPSRVLREIQLPDHPHMHVFAITLEADAPY